MKTWGKSHFVAIGLSIAFLKRAMRHLNKIFGRTSAGRRRGNATTAAKLIFAGMSILCLYVACKVIGKMKFASRLRLQAKAVTNQLRVPASDTIVLKQELRNLEERLANEIMANQVLSTFTCENVKAQLLNPLYGAKHAVAPWYNFRARQNSRRTMLAYSGMRIYPEPRMPKNLAMESRLTIAVHLTIDNLIRLRNLIARLDTRTTGVSASIFVPHHLKTAFWGNHRKAREEVHEEIGCGETVQGWSAQQGGGARGNEGRGEHCPFVDIHIVYADTVDRSNAQCTPGKTPRSCLYYPIQQLRNIALSFVQTEYVMTIDMSFIPSSFGLFTRALGEIHKYERKNGVVDSKRVWVINLRESTCDSTGTFDGCTPGGMLLQDHPSYAPSYKTHVPWQDSNEPQPVEYQFAYEPYFIGKTIELPRYDERFWHGNDKVQQCYDMAAAGFKFFVLPPSVGSLIHWKHAVLTSTPLPLATTKVAMGLLASTIRRAECVWPGARDRFVCDSNFVRRSTWWYRLTTPAFYKIVGCENTEQRLFRKSHLRKFADALDSKERMA